MTDREFFDLCVNHDWAWPNAEGALRWGKGRDSERALAQIARQDPHLSDMLSAFKLVWACRLTGVDPAHMPSYPLMEYWVRPAPSIDQVRPGQMGIFDVL